MPDCRLRRASRGRGNPAGIEPIFQDVEIKTAEIFGAIHLQLGHHRMKFVVVEMLAQFELQLRDAGNRVAIDFQHISHRHHVCQWIKVRGVGE